MIFATLSLSLSAGGPALSIFGVMIFWGVILGATVVLAEVAPSPPSSQVNSQLSSIVEP